MQTITDLTALTQQQLVSSLKSTLCPACGGVKKPRMALCGQDYYRLNPALRKALYKPLGQGYHGAVMQALKCLKKTEFLCPVQNDECRVQSEEGK